MTQGKRIDGFKAALELLQSLDLASQQTLLADMARQDPEMAIKLKSKLVTFDDLQFLTQAMMGKLWSKTMLLDWGLALRGSSGEVKNHILSLLSKNNRSDLEELLKGKPRALSEVMEAQKTIMDVVLEMRERGEIVLSKEGSEKYV
jgi:flagellar motor switch protein FliG